MDAEWCRLDLARRARRQPAPRTLAWAVAELVLGSNPAVWMYACRPRASPTSCLPQRQRAGQEDRPAHGRPPLGRHDGAHRAGRRLRRRRRPHQGHAAADDGTLAHRGRQAVHHHRRARHGREHRPPGARAPGGEGAAARAPRACSLFIVPKFDFDLETGELTGERNGAYVTNVEQKMGIKVSTTCEVTFGENAPARRAGSLGEVHDGIAQMFQVIEYARMMVGTKAIATLSTGYLNALDYAKEPRAGRRPDPCLRQDRAARHDHPPPRRTPLADDAEVVRRGHARAGALHRLVAGPGRRSPAHEGERDELAGAGQRPAAADREGLRLGAVVGAAGHRVAADLRRLGLPAGLPASSSTSATPRSTRSTRAPPRSRARTCSSARSCKDQAAALGFLSEQIQEFVKSEAGNGRLQERARAARHRRSRTPRRSSAR